LWTPSEDDAQAAGELTPKAPNKKVNASKPSTKSALYFIFTVFGLSQRGNDGYGGKRKKRRKFFIALRSFTDEVSGLNEDIHPTGHRAVGLIRIHLSKSSRFHLGEHIG
jgi:hypothetical protein